MCKGFEFWKGRKNNSGQLIPSFQSNCITDPKEVGSSSWEASTVLNMRSQLWGCPSDITYKEKKSSLISDCGQSATSFTQATWSEKWEWKCKCPGAANSKWEFSGSLTASQSTLMDPQPHPGGMMSHYQVLASWMCRVSMTLHVSRGFLELAKTFQRWVYHWKSDRKTIHTFSFPSSPVTQMLASSSSSDVWLKLWPISFHLQ